MLKNSVWEVGKLWPIWYMWSTITPSAAWQVGFMDPASGSTICCLSRSTIIQPGWNLQFSLVGVNLQSLVSALIWHCSFMWTLTGASDLYLHGSMHQWGDIQNVSADCLGRVNPSCSCLESIIRTTSHSTLHSLGSWAMIVAVCVFSWSCLVLLELAALLCSTCV